MSRHRRSFLHWPLLLTAIAFTAAIATAIAQEQTARLVKDANRTPTSININIDWVMPVGQGNNAVFPRVTLAHGKELWTSDGTPKGTRLLKDIVPGPGPSDLRTPVPFGSGDARKVAVINAPLPESPAVWVTDGTEAGTVRVFQAPSGIESELLLMEGSASGVFFQHTNRNPGANYPNLYFTDGTVAGTRLLNPVENGTQRFSFPYTFTSSGPWTYFLGDEGEIWRSDGTVDGTTELNTVAKPNVNRLQVAAGRLFADAAVDSESYELWTCPLEGGEWTRLGPPAGETWTSTGYMTDAGDDLFFVTRNADFSAEVWASDGTVAGTRQIQLVHDGVESFSWGSGMTVWKGSVYLTAQNIDLSQELWRSDGTPAGTVRLASFSKGFAYPVPYELPATADHFHFHAMSDDGAWELWRTQGDVASTRRVRGAPGSYPFSAQGKLIAEGKGGTFFVGDQTTPEEALWRTRGKAAGAVRLTRPEKMNGTGITSALADAPPYEMLDGKLLALLDTGSGHELWRMNPDGSRARSLWKSPEPIVDGYGVIGFHGVTANGALFSIHDSEVLRQLWVTDGTKRGTRLLADHGAGMYDSYPSDFVKLGETWLYAVTNYVEAAQSGLWKTDGTPAGTTKIVAADGTVPDIVAGEMVVFQERVYFLAVSADGKTGLWRSDGTAEGTALLKDVWYGSLNEYATNLSIAAGKIIFTVRRPDSDTLWQSDGTPAGTVPVSPLAKFLNTEISPALDLNGVAIFRAFAQWYRHDATGTRPVRTDVPGYHLSSWDEDSRLSAVAGGLLFYTGLEGDNSELWVTDGTPNGSRIVKEIHPGNVGSFPRGMIAVGDEIYFAARDEEHGTELWRSDGTEAGTVLVADIDPGPAESWPLGLKVMGGKLYFTAYRRDVGRELFVIDLPAE